MTSSYERVKKELNGVENDVEALLSAFGRAVSNVGNGDLEAANSPSVQIGELETRLTIAFNKFEDLLQQLHEASKVGSTAARTAFVQRFADTLVRQQRECNRLKDRYRESQRNLFGSRRVGDSNAHGMDSLLRERSSLTHSHKAADEALTTAVTTQEALLRQRRSLQTASANSLANILSRLPDVQGLISAIRSRRSRNDSIIAVVIGVLICIVLYVKLR